MVKSPSQIDRVQQAQTGGGWFPADTPGPKTPALNANPLQAHLPTLELLITVRLLQETQTGGRLQLDSGTRQTLLTLLQPLTTSPGWSAARATQLRQSILEVLNPAQLGVLERQRSALERAAQTMLSRSKLATPEGPANLVVNRYGWLVPGGVAAVRAVMAAPQVNPYTLSSQNAAVLAQLLKALAAD